MGGNGDLYHNGKKVKKGKRIEMRIYDRIVMGGEVGMCYELFVVEPLNLALPAHAWTV